MPEGDTIFRAARTLALRLRGKKVLAFRSTVPALVGARLEGATVTQVEAVGKNLLVSFDDGRVLVTHMKMTGAWHVYHPGERWFLPAHRMRAVIEVTDCVAVCFSAPVVELHASRGRVNGTRLAGLGPDILAPTFDAGAAATRLLTKPDLPVGEAVLDQGLVAGIGNVYKSETLFLERLSPFVAAKDVPWERLVAVLERARVLMTRNLAPGSGMRTTANLSAFRHWVYRRAREPCFECGALIDMRRQGALNRSTYFCPRCQHVTAA